MAQHITRLDKVYHDMCLSPHCTFALIMANDIITSILRLYCHVCCSKSGPFFLYNQEVKKALPFPTMMTKTRERMRLKYGQKPASSEALNKQKVYPLFHRSHSHRQIVFWTVTLSLEESFKIWTLILEDGEIEHCDEMSNET